MASTYLPLAWPLIAGACLTMGLVHLFAWLKAIGQREHLAFFVLAVSLAAMTLCEFRMMRAQTPEEFGAIMRWTHVPVTTAVLSIVAFVHISFHGARPWLGYSACALRLLALVLNFYFEPNLNYLEITGLRTIEVFGQPASVAEGVPNPLARVGELSSLLLLFFVIDAAVAGWRRGGRVERRRAVVIGGSVMVLIVLAAGNAALIHAGWTHWIYLFSIASLVLMAAMGFELGARMVQTVRLSAALQNSEAELWQSERRMQQAAEAAGIGIREWNIGRNEVWATKQGRALRKQAQDRFRLVVEAAPCGLIVAGMDGRIAFVNATAESLFGVSRQLLIGCSIETLIPGCLESGRFMDLDPAPKQPASKPAKGRHVIGRHRSGGDIPLEMAITPIEGPEGPVVLVMTIDDTALKAVNAELAEERAFLRQVIEVIPGFIFAKDREGRFTLVNQAVADLYATTAAELIGKTDADFNRLPVKAGEFLSTDLEVMDTLQERAVQEERITDAAGKAHWLMTVKRPLVSEDGTASHVLGSGTDISERKRTELELEQQRSELAHLSRVTMLSELSGSLAHELNQPLAAILSNAQAALRFLDQASPDLKEMREILQDIVADDRRAGEVIQGLRTMLKKGELRQEPLDLNDVVRDVLRLVRSDMLNAGVSLTLQLAPDLPVVIGDRVQLQQVLLNLVVNGCEAMTGGADKRRLLVSTELAADGGARLCVADSGPGIPSQNLERVFEPFFTTKKYGMGLGLSVCRRIISTHGGKLAVASDSSRGTRFYFTLPERSEAIA